MAHDVRAVLLLGENANISFSATMPFQEPLNGKITLQTGDKGLVQLLKKGMLCRIQVSGQTEITAKILRSSVDEDNGSLVMECAV